MSGLKSEAGRPTLATIIGRRARRRARRFAHLRSPILTLSQRLLAASLIVVAVAMVALGFWASQYLKQGITEGVAATAAASIDSLTAWHLRNLETARPLSTEERTRISEVFEIGNDASSTRLLQFRIHDLDGTLYYDSADGLVDAEDTGHLIAAAARGETIANIRELVLEPVGPLAGHRIEVLKIYSPLHRPATGEIFAVAELYYSARSVLELQARTQRDVWLIVGLIGAAIAGALYLLIDRASRTISRQRTLLARNLASSRRLAEENRSLHAGSERLRVSANSSNESLLAQVGTDIHDGPLQLLTLVILLLTQQRAAAGGANGLEAGGLDATIQLTTEAMDELRTISTGLVLPELAALNLQETLLLAIERHEQTTGTEVARKLHELPGTASIAVKICAYRIVQEALNNAFRHGGAVEQFVGAQTAGGTLTIEVANGSEVVETPPPTAGAGRLGLRGMRFRVESLGGTVHVDIGAPRSTVTAEIPLNDQHAPD